MSAREESEIKQNYIDCLGEPLGTLFFSLYKNFCRIALNWNEYCELFAKEEKQIHLFNSIAPHFFGTIQNVLLDDVILQIARIVDSEKTSGKSNLTVKMLTALVDKSIQNSVCAKINQIELLTAFCKETRNRRIAHNDYLISTGDVTSKPLPDVTRKQIREALAAIEDLLNFTERFYNDSEVSYMNIIAPLGGSNALVFHLKQISDSTSPF